jgi:hypothetical protein
MDLSRGLGDVYKRQPIVQICSELLSRGVTVDKRLSK